MRPLGLLLVGRTEAWGTHLGGGEARQGDGGSRQYDAERLLQWLFLHVELLDFKRRCALLRRLA
jgi:hypothetical protein